MKKSTTLVKLALCTVLSAALLGGCGNSAKTETTTAAAETTGETSEKAEAADGTYTIGITQIAEHGSLDNCREGFLEGLASEGFVEGKNLTVDYQNAQGDTANASMIAQNFVSKKYDLVCAVATPSAMACFNAAQGTEIPTIFTAVSDPVAAELVASLEAPGSNCTGTSDALPVEDQLKMIRAMMPDAKTIGIMYTTSEVNSITNLETYKELAPKYDFEIVESGVASSSDIPIALDSLVTKVDCISNLTDNNVVNNLDTVIAKATEAGIPVFGSEVEQVVNGCAASMGLDYTELGRQTGVMAAAVLNGEDAATMPVQVISASSLYVNSDVMSQFNLSVPDEYKDSYSEAE
ncbi:MAG: ABC transporter substrate-binding protein [Clostridia bacterium]|nr:ABC transporter substrate-binding protein [Lachnospiraceae bacterium]NCC00842.1 ABC transporter substrate-binding protein [Clostridia bacterium]NCD02072.1 ABC transporter substrate-binding protein [Clostridia bacterium]